VLHRQQKRGALRRPFLLGNGNYDATQLHHRHRERQRSDPVSSKVLDRFVAAAPRDDGCSVYSE